MSSRDQQDEQASSIEAFVDSSMDIEEANREVAKAYAEGVHAATEQIVALIDKYEANALEAQKGFSSASRGWETLEEQAEVCRDLKLWIGMSNRIERGEHKEQA